MAYDPVHQVRTHVVTLADPDPQIIVLVLEHERAPMAIMQIHHVAEAGFRRGRGEGGRAGRMHQHFALGIPHLKGKLALIGMAIDPGNRFAQGLVERLIQLGVFLARHGHAHHTLQQPGILGQLGIVDFGDFVVAVMQIEHADHPQAGEHQADDQGQGATPDRGHRRSSTR
ncbi:hypothetical protein D3C86_1558600 [compost metagenome]